MKKQSTNKQNLQNRLSFLQKNNAGLEDSEGKLKKLERDLKQELYLSNSVINATDVLVLVLDKQGRVVGFNRACEKITGYTLQEVLCKKVFELSLISKKKSPSRKLFKKLFNTDFYHRGESVLYTRSGERKIVQWSNKPLTSNTDEKSYIVMTGVDVTEQFKSKKNCSGRLKI